MTREELNQQKQEEILNEERREKRKKTTLFMLKAAGAIIVGFLIFYLYTTYVSSRIVSVKEKRIVNEKVPENFNGLKVIQFSDLHFGTTIFMNEVESLVKKINSRNPDIVVFSGDLIDISYDLQTTEQEELIKQLKKINAKLGKYAVGGDEDKESFLTIMNQSDFIVLDNNYELIYNNSSSPILLVGLGSLLNNNQDVKKAFSYYSIPTYNSNIFSITLAHEPDSIDYVLENYNTNLFLAGHSHNGTVRIPFIGGIYGVEGAKKYNNPYYKVNDTDLFISSGIGTNGPGFRLFCRPSVNFFRISNK